MAGGYLGKISAVISANTGDYVRKLNESAKETRAFAATVQNTLARASRDATKSLESIYTPLQKVERALRAAASEKLAFRGFDGAIRDVQSLQKALAGLQDQRTIDLVVKTSGLGSLDELKRTLNVLRNQDVTVGVESLRAQRAALGNTNNFVVKTQVREEGQRLDSVIEALERIDAERIKTISLQVEDAQLTSATTQFRRLTELSTQIGGPLAKVQAEFSGLAGSIQAQFIPALARTQAAYEEFQQRIKAGSGVSGSEFRDLAADVRVVEAAIGRLRETAAAGSRLFSGEELTFVRPQALDELNRLAEAQKQLAAAPASVRSSPIARELLADGKVLEEQINRITARIERLNAQGLDISVSQAGLDLAIRRLQEVRRLTEEVSSGGGASDGFIDVGFLKSSGVAAKQVQLAAVEIDVAVDALQRSARRARAVQDEARFDLAESLPFINVGTVTARAVDARQAQIDAVRVDVPLDTLRASAANVGRDPAAAARDLGDAVDSPNRAFANLLGTITSLKGQLDTLPAGVRGQFVPAIQAAEAEYTRLFSTAGVTADQIREAAANLQGLRQGLTAATTAAAQFGGTFAQFRNASDGRVAAAGLDFLRTALSRATGDTTRAAAALDALSAAQLRAATTPTGFRDNAAELQRLTNEAIEATAAVEGVGRSQRSLQRGFARVGDVARGSFGNAGLAIQQAAFAFEDFFSVTGGLDQRIRAAGNNISQLGFILGGTWGLGVGIAVSVGSQFTLMLIDWYNEGRKTEDRLKSLNETLEKQKNTVQQLAEAYGKVVDRIKEAGAAALSPDSRRQSEISQQVNEVRNRQRESREQRILGASPSVQDARAAVAARERELSQASTAAARVRAQLRLEQDRRRLSREEQRTLAAGDRPGRDEIAGTVRRVVPQPGLLFSREQTDELARRLNARLAAVGDDPQRQLSVLRNARQTQASVSSNFIGRNIIAPDSEEVLVALDQLIARLESSEQGAKIDKALSRITENALRIASAMEFAGADIQRAFEGTSGSSAISAEIEAFSESLTQFIAAAQAAAERGDVTQAQALNADVNAIKSHIKSLQDAAAAVSVFGSALQRLSESVSRDLSTLEQRADEARRTDIAQGTQRSGNARARADRDVQEARRNQRAFEDQRASELEQFEQNALLRGDRRMRRAREIDAMLAVPMGGVGADGTRGGTAEERRAARAERSRIREEVEREFENSTGYQVNQAQANAVTRLTERAKMIDQGMELLLTPGQRAGMDLNQQLAKIAAASDERRRMDQEKTGGVNRARIDADEEKAKQRAREEAFRQQAPAIFALADGIQNALLQGPSRAALQASDVSTVEGAKELNRLLRGDDPSKNENLVELRRQSELLKDLVDAAKNPAVVDL